jgi:hypothetical protein
MNDTTTKREKKDRGPKLEYEKRKIITKKFRAQFLHRCYTPNDDDKYSICAIFDNNVDRQEMKSEIQRVVTEAFGKLKPGMKMPFRKGSEKKLDEEDGSGFAGFDETNVFCNMTTFRQPIIRDEYKNILTEEDFKENRLKSGDYFLACVIAEPFNHKGKKGAKFTLSSLLWLEEGEALFEGSGRSDPLEDFKDHFKGDPSDDFDNQQAVEDDLDDLIT